MWSAVHCSFCFFNLLILSLSLSLLLPIYIYIWESMKNTSMQRVRYVKSFFLQGLPRNKPGTVDRFAVRETGVYFVYFAISLPPYSGDLSLQVDIYWYKMYASDQRQNAALHSHLPCLSAVSFYAGSSENLTMATRIKITWLKNLFGIFSYSKFLEPISSVYLKLNKIEYNQMKSVNSYIFLMLFTFWLSQKK